MSVAGVTGDGVIIRRASGLCAQGDWSSHRAPHPASPMVAVDHPFSRRSADGIDACLVSGETLSAVVWRHGTTMTTDDFDQDLTGRRDNIRDHLLGLRAVRFTPSCIVLVRACRS